MNWRNFTVGKKTKGRSKHAQCKHSQWNANPRAENSSWDSLFFPLSSWVWTPKERGGKCLCVSENLGKIKQTFFPLMLWKIGLQLQLQLGLLRKDLSSFQALQFSSPYCCIWLFYFFKHRVGFAGKETKMGMSNKEHDSGVYCLRHSPAKRKGRRRKLLSLF